MQWFGDFVGLLPQAVVVAKMIGERIRMPPFVAEFDRTSNIGRALVLTGDDGVTGFHLLQQRIAAELRALGFEKLVDPDYRPHMTLLYDERHVGDKLVNPIRWWVRELVLVHSLLGRTHYNLLARFPLL